MREEIAWQVEPTVKPDQLDDFRDSTGEMVEATRPEPGVLRAHLDKPGATYFQPLGHFAYLA